MKAYKDGLGYELQEGDLVIIACHDSIMRHQYLAYGMIGDRTKTDQLRVKASYIRYGKRERVAKTSYQNSSHMLRLHPDQVPMEIREALRAEEE